VPPGLSFNWPRQSNLYRVPVLRVIHTLIAPPRFPRHGAQHNGIQSTPEAMAVVTTFRPHLLCWGAVPVWHRCRDVRTAGPGAWHLHHGLYVSTSPMLHSQISLTGPQQFVWCVAPSIEVYLFFTLIHRIWKPPALVVRLISAAFVFPSAS
jgi:hypothetical protein